ncbi:MAG: DinB family protein [Candidatus Acidiferrales bacterium]
MKRLAWAAFVLLLIPTAGLAQDQSNQPVPNPVSSNIKQQLARYSKIMIAAADSMPAEKFTYSPTPQQMTFAHLTAHIATSNTFLCSKISGTPAPDLKLADMDPKDQLVAGLKASFDYCTTALATVDDSKLGQSIVLFGNRPNTIAGAMISITNDWADHYSAQASYLRLNGILPPTAQPAPAH